MPEVVNCDLAVIGAGPGGYPAAFLAADKGMNVTLIDAGPKPGGVCLHCGCIPSKALLHAGHYLTGAREAAEWGITFMPPEIDLTTLRNRKEKIINNLANHLIEACKRRKINYIKGRAGFTSSKSVQVEGGPQVQ